MIKWTEIALTPSVWRYEVLSEELKLCGVENTFIPTQVANLDVVQDTIASAKNEFAQIRLGAKLGEVVLHEDANLPAQLLITRGADALVPELGQWWPRCFYFDGVTRTLVQDLTNLDLRGGVFIMGANWEARVLIAALTRAGFQKFLVSDIEEAPAQKLVKDLERIHFGVSFQYVQKELVTQLPGTNSIAINILSLVEHPGLVSDLSYLNFLRPDGVWIETQPYPENSPLTVEALSLGVQVEPALHLVSNVDAVWAEYCFKTKIDLPRYREALSASLKNRN
jgi:hypothetical protein